MSIGDNFKKFNCICGSFVTVNMDYKPKIILVQCSRCGSQIDTRS